MQVSASTMAAIRFGYGFHPHLTTPEDAGELLAGLAPAARAPLVYPVPGSVERRASIEAYIEARKAKKKMLRRGLREEMRQQKLIDGQRRVFQRALGPSGFFERLSAFWADHFTVAARTPAQVYHMPVFEIEAIRPHVMGRFADMLTAAVKHPVMLHYLDQVDSFGPNSRIGQKRDRGLNENLAREMLELHTLGVGGPYTQDDVLELAELLTGYGAQKGYLRFRFFEDRAEPGPETVLGQTYGGDAPAAEDAAELLEDLARHESTAQHLARKLAVHFVADEPDPDLVRHVAAAWQRTDGDLPAVYAALLEHPAAWRDFGAKVKRPVDFMASMLRAIGADRGMATEDHPPYGFVVGKMLVDLNQPMFRAVGPDGWPEQAEAWITPQGLAVRIKLSARVGRIFSRMSDIEPRVFAARTLRDALRPETALTLGSATRRWEGLAVTLASPEFNRR